ncbi:MULTISPECIES: hypothetical protein [Halorussus]|uniref:hypothetical protein n=1 Tax=Halorussus TaxID=1070314 RepID=UPI000E215074|nr:MULTISPECIES: hypothetical protein [Halorussus]NHN58871.1 hypothetical protein [Halorussus sp. JP-T4]
MKRRSFLRLAAGATAVTAGCVGGSVTDARLADGDGPGGTAARMAAAGAGGPGAGSRDLSVSAVETFDHAVRLNDLGTDPGGRVTPFADLSDREREVVLAALSGGYRTDDPSAWLRRFASATPFVERDGTYYRLEDTFPTHRVTAETVAESDVTGETADYETYRRAVTREGYVASGLLRLARDGGVELSYVWPALASFFETYDAARYHGDVVSFSIEVTDAGPPYAITGAEVPVSTAVDGSVWNADAAAARTRGLLRRAGRATGAYGFDRAPPGLLANLREHRYVRLDGTFYTTYVEAHDPVPVSVAATVRDGRLRLSLRNDGDAGLRLASGAPRPFGVVRCEPARGADSRDAARLLWTDAYAASDRVRTDGRRVEATDDLALVTTVGPGEAIDETYAVPADLSPGEYAVEGSLDVAGPERDETAGGTTGKDRGTTVASADESTVRYRVTFEVE